MKVWPGKPYPLGATWDGAGTNFALYSENATKVELCLFDAPGDREEQHRIRLTEYTNLVWHAYLPDVRPEQLYGYRVYGPWEPEQGHRFNPNKLLLDPYAKCIGRQLSLCDEVFAYRIGEDDTTFDDRDSAPFAALGMVIDTAFTWGDDRPPHIPMHRSIIYEAHTKGFTRLHPGIPEDIRGTYRALGSSEVIEYLQQLGITAVELLPVQYFVHERDLLERGLSNYWGYNSIGYFAPTADYSATDDPMEVVREFKTMVKNLHRARMEVILDVVYNHTAEGNEYGPNISFRGIDNANYYRLNEENPRRYVDFTGCGNTLLMRNPRVLQLIMDSLRYWILEMHVDGFRFDLASTLARELYEVNQLSAFFDIIHQDPVISQVKLIAEPWDIAEGGYQVGNFPVLWSEWNGQYRDTVRRFWNGKGGSVSTLATRLFGSSDLYELTDRRPSASINFVTCHDGFTLHDLVSYDDKHNEANGEENRDGSDNNISDNCGVEGPTDDPDVLRLRRTRQRSFLATLLFSIGVPMLRAGDELNQTQLGNNNAYCQDNEISWINWELGEYEHSLLEFTKQLIALRQNQPVMQRRRFMHGLSVRGGDTPPVAWLNTKGEEMSDDDWHRESNRQLGMLFRGGEIDVDFVGRPIRGDWMLVLFNGDQDAPVPFVLPKAPLEPLWKLLLDTARPEYMGDFEERGVYECQPSSLAAFSTRGLDG